MQTPPADTASRPRSDDLPRVLAIGLVVALCAAAPRVLRPEGFITADEGAFWFTRTEAFEDALRTGRLGKTWQAPHPGVTTMWAGMAGRAAFRAAGGDTDATDAESGERLRRDQRRAVAVACSASLGLGAALAARLWGPAVGLFAGFLWAFEPFLVAHGKILHTDALASCFLVTGVLSCVLARREASRGLWVLGSVVIALAGLSKLPGFFGIPMVAGVLAVEFWPETSGTVGRRAAEVFRRTIRPMLALGAVVAAVIVLLWPAVWAAPLAVLHGFVYGIELGVSVHENGNFFLGSYVENPGALFYLVAIPFRLAPASTVGLFLGIGLMFLGDRRPRLAVACAALVLVVITIGGKKFDRYALPIFPFLDLVAAIGWTGLLAAVRARTPILASGLGALAGAAIVVPILAFHPYEISFYNPLLGGGNVAFRALLYGWGEGLEQVAGWMRAHEPDCRRTIASPYDSSLQPLLCQQVSGPETSKRADYVVFYANQIQRGHGARTFRGYDKDEPLFVARSPDGVPIAWLYAGHHTVK